MKQIATPIEKDAFFDAVEKELNHAESKFDWWPTDPIHGVTIITEEVGEAAEAALKYHYEDEPIENLEEELIQVATTAMRCWISIKRNKILTS